MRGCDNLVPRLSEPSQEEDGGRVVGWDGEGTSVCSRTSKGEERAVGEDGWRE